jgi:TolA-binding protein
MSESKSRTSHPIEDLSVLSRRGGLSSAEQRAFVDALDTNPALATAHQVGLDFDQVATVKPGDDALIADVAARVVSRGRTAKTARSRLRLRALLLAATLPLAGSAAAWWQRARTSQPAPPAVTPTSQTSRGMRVPKVTSAAAAATSAVAAHSQPTSASASAAVVASAPVSAPGARGDAPSPRAFDSAEGLFREANAARRAGDSSVARALYLRLQRDFPASEEAHLAHVSLGNLLLTMGRAAEAERQFASYLGGRPALAQEALVGRAQSLAALGQSAEEQRVWEALLREYPSSVYATRAKLRLAKLTSSAAAPN